MTNCYWNLLKHCIIQFLWKFEEDWTFFHEFMAENDHFQTVSIEQLRTKIAIEPIKRNQIIAMLNTIESQSNGRILGNMTNCYWNLLKHCIIKFLWKFEEDWTFFHEFMAENVHSRRCRSNNFERKSQSNAIEPIKRNRMQSNRITQSNIIKSIELKFTAIFDWFDYIRQSNGKSWVIFDCVRLRSINSAFDWFDWHRLVILEFFS